MRRVGFKFRFRGVVSSRESAPMGEKDIDHDAWEIIFSNNLNTCCHFQEGNKANKTRRNRGYITSLVLDINRHLACF